MKKQILLTFLAVVFLGIATVRAQDAAVGVTGGGVLVKGWTGKIDAKEEAAGLTLTVQSSFRRAMRCASLPARR